MEILKLLQFKMAISKPAFKANNEAISKTRAANASLLTLLTLIMFVVWGIHGYWAAKVIIFDGYGGWLNNLVYGLGTFLLNVGLCLKVMSYINIQLLDKRIEDDYKKYI